MDKEQLKSKLEALEANVEVKRDEYGVAVSEAQMAREELANLGKTVISEDDVASLVDLLQGMFHDILNDCDTSDLSPEFSIGYDNTIELDCIDMSRIEVHSGDIENVLEQVFNIESDNS